VQFIHDRLAPMAFGLPGSSTVSLFNELGRVSAPFVSALQENAAVAMADGYSRFAGPTGLLLYMLPGLATGLGNLYNASRDESPLVLILGQVATTARRGMYAVGEADLAALASPFVNFAAEVDDPVDLVDALDTAFHCTTGLPNGPSLVAVPEDVLTGASPGWPARPATADKTPSLAADAVNDLARRLSRAERPLIIVGGQVRRLGASADVQALAAALAAPVLFEPFWNDRLGIAPTDSCCFGQVSEHSRLVNEADVVLLLGCRFFNEIQPRTTPWFPTAFVAHVNADPAKIAAARPSAWSTATDPSVVARDLLEAVRRIGTERSLIDARRARLEAARRRRGNRSTLYSGVAAALSDALDRGYLVDESVTASATLVSNIRSSHAERYVSTTGGSLGWGIAASAGIALATRDRVTCVVGDGAFFFGLHGLWPASCLQLPIDYVVIDNGGFGSTQMYERDYLLQSGRADAVVTAVGSDFRTGRPSAVDIARSFGIEAHEVESPDDLRARLHENSRGPRLFRCSVEA
jgi:thiamine pyrophosphate-dependent acetolactate synthase large subunit-like protein